MKKIKIIADSACDLLTLKQADFTCVPMKIMTGKKEFSDDQALDVNAMLQELAQYQGKVRSSCPGILDWLRAFGDADDIICVTVSGALAGSSNAACTAKRYYESEYTGKRVFVADTLSAGPEMTLIVERIGELAANGASYEEICTNVTEYMKSTGLLFALKSMKILTDNKRISPETAKMAGIAGLRVIGKADGDGKILPIGKCRGRHQTLSLLTDALCAEGFRSGKIRIAHCQNESEAQALREMILARFPDASVEVSPLRGICSFYAEKGAILLGFEKKI